MSASADYNVSIIENFAPPKQWVPGQSVTKEEAVVNTGNIDAFVHQTISGVMDISVEVASTEAPVGTDAAGYIKLKPAEAGSLEAGSYLAYAPEGETAGNKVISVIPDTEGSEKLTDFNPKTTGLYIFRRAITVAPGDTSPAVDQKYEYVGYYYVAKDGDTVGGQGTYYKLHNLYDSTLVLKENTDGDLASAPTVTYAKETKKTLNKVPMKYEAAAAAVGNPTDANYVPAHGDRLVISYDKNASADTTDYNQLTFEKYRDYLDKLQGKTTWDTTKSTTGGDTPVGKDPVNTTGLTDHDDYGETPDSNTPAVNYSNYSLKRLETRKGETEEDVKEASPQTNNAVDWVTVYNNAKADRKTINRGVKAAEALRALRTTVEGLIGISADGTAPGLYQSRTDYSDNFHYKATAETMSPEAEGAVVLRTPTANTGNTLTEATYDDGTGTETTSNLNQMTADTMDQSIFAHYNSSGVKWNVVTKPYAASASTSDFAKAWDAYENAVKEQKLIEAKIAICNAMASSPSTTSVARVTLEGGGYIEVSEYKAILSAALTEAQKDVEKKKELFEAQQKIVKDDISTINGYQDEVNAANEVDYGTSAVQDDVTVAETTYSAVYVGDKSTAASYPSETDTTHNGYKSVVYDSTTNEGKTDSLDEDVLEAYLKAVYGIALKDTSTESQADYWNGTTHMAQPTYSPTVTKNTIDGNLTSNEGIIGWKATADLEDGVTELSASDKALVANSLYYEDQKVGFMKAYREKEVNNAKAAYDAAVRAENGQGAVAEDGIVKIYVNLANVGNGETKEQWQYIADAATEEGKDFNFYYTSILPSGQTSSLLIESVEFDKDVKQHAFRDIQLDLNVVAESAQVVYNGDVIEATAANATITGAKTTADTYATVDGPVKWVARTAETPTTENITDKDPNPKADADVTAP